MRKVRDLMKSALVAMVALTVFVACSSNDEDVSADDITATDENTTTDANTDDSQTDCNELFISEYVEGRSNDKAIEIYNPTANAIDLSSYQLQRYSNGGTSLDDQKRLNLSGSIPAYGTYVIINKTEDPTDSKLVAVADMEVSDDYSVNNVMFFNGDDAMVLVKVDGGSETILDIFGKVGEDPGTAWTDVAPYTDAAGTWLSKDRVLIRKATDVTGISTNPALFNALANYDSLDRSMMDYKVDGGADANDPADKYLNNPFENLGSHTCDCKK